MNEIETALSSNQPYFGHAVRGIQSGPLRYAILRSLVKGVINQEYTNSINVLEVGSWIGASALTFARSIQDFNGGDGLVTCVDKWEPYIDTSIDNGSTSQIMSLAIELNIAYTLFQHNCKCCNIEHLVEVKRGTSQDILAKLIDGKKFDVIYIDGDHRYEAVVGDILMAKKLLASGGILCGDDLEKQVHEVDLDILQKGVEEGRDTIVSGEKGYSFHPGVTLAVNEAIGEVSSYAGLWLMVNQEDGLVRLQEIEIDENIPKELLKFYPPDLFPQSKPL